MADNETKVHAALAMDRSDALGNSLDNEGRRALHVKNLAQLVIKNYDAGTVLYPDDITEVYQFRVGGMAGTIVQTVTLVYTDDSKENLAGWESVIP